MIDIFKYRVKNLTGLIKVKTVQFLDHVFYRHPWSSVDQYHWSIPFDTKGAFL